MLTQRRILPAFGTFLSLIRVHLSQDIVLRYAMIHLSNSLTNFSAWKQLSPLLSLLFACAFFDGNADLHEPASRVISKMIEFIESLGNSDDYSNKVCKEVMSMATVWVQKLFSMDRAKSRDTVWHYFPLPESAVFSNLKKYLEQELDMKLANILPLICKTFACQSKLNTTKTLFRLLCVVLENATDDAILQVLDKTSLRQTMSIVKTASASGCVNFLEIVLLKLEDYSGLLNLYLTYP
jgi:hypothetical protein